MSPNFLRFCPTELGVSLFMFQWRHLDIDTDWGTDTSFHDMVKMTSYGPSLVIAVLKTPDHPVARKGKES